MTPDEIEEIVTKVVRREVQYLVQHIHQEFNKFDFGRAIDALEAKNNERVILTPNRVATLLGISKATIFEWTKDGLLKKHKVGTKAYYYLDDIINIIDSYERGDKKVIKKFRKWETKPE